MSIQPSVPKLTVEALRDAIRLEYSSVAQFPDKGYHFHTGRNAAQVHGYDPALYDGVPEESIESFAGVGNPFLAGPISRGETVLDIGSGAGMDALIASKMVGPEGRVIGIDMTEEMREKARKSAEKMGADHVEFRHGYMEALPIEDETIDVIISNGVLNLATDKPNTLREWFRVLRPGGRLQIGDIIIERPVPQSAIEDISLWTGWIAGGLLEADLISVVGAAGFENAAILQKYATFEGVPDPSSALNFGTQGITLFARKPA